MVEKSAGHSGTPRTDGCTPWFPWVDLPENPAQGLAVLELIAFFAKAANCRICHCHSLVKLNHYMFLAFGFVYVTFIICMG